MDKKIIAVTALLLLLLPVCSSALVTEFYGLVVYDDGFSVREGATVVAKNQAGYELGKVTTSEPGLYRISVSGTVDDVIVFYVNGVMANGFTILGNDTTAMRTITVNHEVISTPIPTLTQTTNESSTPMINLFGMFPIRNENELVIVIIMTSLALTGVFVFALYYIIFIRSSRKDSGGPDRDYEKDFKY